MSQALSAENPAEVGLKILRCRSSEVFSTLPRMSFPFYSRRIAGYIAPGLSLKVHQGVTVTTFRNSYPDDGFRWSNPRSA